MIVPKFMRFYGYTASQALSERAQTFFALVNSMYRVQAEDSIRDIVNTSAAMNGHQETIAELRKQERGVAGIVREVRGIKNGKH